MSKSKDFLQFYSFTYQMNDYMDIAYPMDVSCINSLSKAGNVYFHIERIEDNLIRLIKCDIEEKWMKVILLNKKNKILGETDINKFERGKVIDLDTKGTRWEGDCLERVPFGFGCFYNSENQLIYKGFMIDRMKVCYGIEMYGDVGIVEYEGNFYNGSRCGYGKLYDKKNELVYEGEWFNNKSIMERSITINQIKNSNIHFGIEELTIGTHCLRSLHTFRLCRYNHLKKVEIKENQMILMRDFCIEECDELLNVKLCGEKQDTFNQNIDENVVNNIQSKKEFQIKNCKKLAEISIDQYWYENCKEVVLSSI